MKKKRKFWIAVYLISVIVLAIIIYFIPSVTGMLRPTEVLTYGSIKETDHEECYFVRDEKVYMSSAAGDINYYFENGDKVRRNTTILTVNNNGKEKEKSEYEDIITRLGKNAVIKTDYMSDFNGIVSYYVDGYESYFTPEKIFSLDYKKVKSLKIDDPVDLARKTTYKKEPLYKICRNERWYATCWVDEGNITKYEEGNLVVLALPKGEVEAIVTGIKECGDKWQIAFGTTRYYEDFDRIRKEEIDIITSDCNGLIVNNGSIATVDGNVGLYVKQKTGDYEFVPIKIYESDGENSAVAENFYYDKDGKRVETVKIYDEILRNPE